MSEQGMRRLDADPSRNPLLLTAAAILGTGLIVAAAVAFSGPGPDELCRSAGGTWRSEPSSVVIGTDVYPTAENWCEQR